MTTETRKPKQTAGNNAFLRETKRIFNTKIYKRCMDILNAEGEQAARAYLHQYMHELDY